MVVTRIKIILPVAISVAEPPSEAWEEAQDVIWTYSAGAFLHKLKSDSIYGVDVCIRAAPRSPVLLPYPRSYSDSHGGTPQKTRLSQGELPFRLLQKRGPLVSQLWWR